MSIETLTRIAELKTERDDLEEQLNKLDERIASLIGQGFEIPGLVRVTPMKRGSYKRTQAAETMTLVSKLDDGHGALAVPSKQVRPDTTKPSAETIANTMLEAMAKQQLKAWSAPELLAHLQKLGHAYKLQWVASGFYWLGQAGKLDRLGQGLYRFRKAA